MSLVSDLRTWLVLGRTSNLPTVWTNVAVGWFLCGGGWVPEFAWILLGMSLLYLAGMTLNDAFDAKWDREHATERPIPSGRISVGAVWILGLVQLAGGIAVLAALTTVHPLLLGGLVLSILLYDLLHKRWAGSVLIMGLCRALVYVGAGSAVVSGTTAISVSTSVLLIAGGVVLYIAGLTLAARSEHLDTASGPNFLVRILLMLPVLFPLFAARTQETSLVVSALVTVGILAIWAWLVITRAGFQEKVPLGVARGIAGIALFDAAAVVFADWRAAVFAVACFLLTLLAQRKIPAT